MVSAVLFFCLVFSLLFFEILISVEVRNDLMRSARFHSRKVWDRSLGAAGDALKFVFQNLKVVNRSLS